MLYNVSCIYFNRQTKYMFGCQRASKKGKYLLNFVPFPDRLCKGRDGLGSENPQSMRQFRFPALDHTARNLMWIRGLRSVGQGAMVVDLTLYLQHLKWSGAAIGGVTSAAGLFAAALILGVGISSDKFGRRPFLFVYESMTLLSAVLACFTTAAVWLSAIIIITGFGRGQGGAAGPFAPAEQAWLAHHVKRIHRGAVFSLNSAVGFIGMAVGAALGGIPATLQVQHPIDAFRPVFVVVAVVSAICLIMLVNMPEQRHQVAKLPILPNDEHSHEHSDGDSSTSNEVASEVDKLQEMRDLAAKQQSDENIRVRRQENKSMLQFALVNAINGLAVGLTGPMFAYWFSLRYGVNTADVGMTFAIGFLLTGISSLLNGYFAQRFGMVKSVTWMRVIGSLMMIAMPFMPTFASASVLYVIRGAINRGTQGNRSALSASITKDNRRGFAISLNALSMRLPSGIGPAITGGLFDVGLLGLPLMLTAVLQFTNAVLYQKLFGKFDHNQNAGDSTTSSTGR